MKRRTLWACCVTLGAFLLLAGNAGGTEMIDLGTLGGI